MSKSVWAQTAPSHHPHVNKEVLRDRENMQSLVHILVMLETAMDHALYADASVWYHRHIKHGGDDDHYPDSILAYEILSARRTLETAQEAAIRICLKQEDPAHFLLALLDDIGLDDFDASDLLSCIKRHGKDHEIDGILPTHQNDVEYAIAIYVEIIAATYHGKKDIMGAAEKVLYESLLGRMGQWLTAMDDGHDITAILTPIKPDQGIPSIENGFSATKGALKIQFAQTEQLLSSYGNVTSQTAPIVNALLIKCLFLHDNMMALDTMRRRGLWPTVYEESAYHLLTECAAHKLSAPDMTPMMGAGFFALRCYYEAIDDPDIALDPDHEAHRHILHRTTQDTITLAATLLGIPPRP